MSCKIQLQPNQTQLNKLIEVFMIRQVRVFQSWSTSRTIYLNRSVISSFNTSEYYWFYSIFTVSNRCSLGEKKKKTLTF